MELKQRIIAYIIKNAPVTMDTVISEATAKGYTEAEVLTALDVVHRDKRLTQTANTAGVVTYKLANAKKAPTDHLKWIKNNYPIMTPETDGSGIDIDMGHLFLKTKEERDAYLAEMKGRPVHMLKSKNYG